MAKDHVTELVRTITDVILEAVSAVVSMDSHATSTAAR